ncbi:MAG: hypothetical protein A2201_03450 [Alicyclobacillus sp. RIFOXYA1_FULL_53_8]|nr:MAG: hypothetical protein A2201_03450 [Alicyclobacillus sp. RIFOXYA1_FULL_53_8]
MDLLCSYGFSEKCSQIAMRLSDGFLHKPEGCLHELITGQFRNIDGFTHLDGSKGHRELNM